MKNTGFQPRFAKIGAVPDFRIDFAATAALIGLPQLCSLPVMPADLPETPVPLAEISQGPNAFEEFLDRNQKNLIILAILLALGAAALVVYRGIEKSNQETAGAALNKAENLAALQDVISRHAGTNAARSAMILLADRQWNEGQQDASIETLRKFIAESPDHPALPTAQANLGAKLMFQGKTPEATQAFESIVNDPKARYIAPYALISLGDIAKVAGDLEKAEASYTRVTVDFSDSGFADTANRRIATLKAKAPVEIEPPPAPTTDTPATPGIPATPGNPAVPPSPAPEAPAPAEIPPAEAPAATPPQESKPAAGNEEKPADAPAAPQP